MKLGVVSFVCSSLVLCCHEGYAQVGARSWACYAQNTWLPTTGSAGAWAPEATRQKAARLALASCTESISRRGEGKCRIFGCESFDSVAAANASQCYLNNKYRIGQGHTTDGVNCN